MRVYSILWLLAFVLVTVSIPLDGRAYSSATTGNTIGKTQSSGSHSKPSRLFSLRRPIISKPQKIQQEFVDNDGTKPFEPLKIALEVNGYLIPAIIDTGAQISIMSESCAKRCRLFNSIDSRFGGLAYGVGTTNILGRIDGTKLRIGPVSFQSEISVLHNTQVDFLIGLDILRRFDCDVNLREGYLMFTVQNNRVKVPFIHTNNRIRLGNIGTQHMIGEEVAFVGAGYKSKEQQYDYYYEENDDEKSDADRIIERIKQSKENKRRKAAIKSTKYDHTGDNDDGDDDDGCGNEYELDDPVSLEGV